jgi:nucleoporin GLE1
VSLWNDFPKFWKAPARLFFYTQCPYLVPFLYSKKQKKQTNEEYYVSLGYRYVDGQIEKQDKFLKRMTGIFKTVLCHPDCKNQREGSQKKST